ncbi:MAG TPA: hypothetical protein VKB43_11035 [Gaiellaceae bacterium]|nr:hypothetical protein [Gaiellaceae bacterium]
MRYAATLALGAVLLALCGCGSSHGADATSALRIYGPTGSNPAQVTLADIVRRQIRVTTAYRAGEADLWLPLTHAGNAACVRLAHALARRGARVHNRHEPFALNVDGHVYAIDPADSVDYRYPTVLCGEAPPAIDIRLKHTTAQRLVRVLKTAKIASTSVGEQRFFFTPGRNGASCEIDFDMPELSEAWCLAYQSSRPERTALAVALRPDGTIKVCHGCVGNAPDQTQTLRYGQSVSLGPFRCTALRAGVRCVIRKSGHGYLLGIQRLRRI